MRLRPAPHDDLVPLLDDLRISFAATDADRERVALAIASSDDGIVVVDTQGREIVRSLGAERFRAARHSDALAQEVVERLLRGALDGVEDEEELSLFGPPRETLVVQGVPLRSTDMSVVGAAAYVRDVTELRRIESVRRDFVANVSHELKTPIGAMGLLAETFQSCDDVQVARRLADQLVRECDRLARIVDDLLDLSQAEALEHPVRDRVTVGVLVDEAVQRVRAIALARDIALRVDDIAGELSVECDPRQLVGALTNLLDNAVKYSEDGRAVDVSAVATDGRVVINVRDEGIGIPSRDLERVFERFYRVDKARSRATGGTGLGLSIVRHVAQAHGGEVMVESVEGVGSNFRLILPLAGATSEAA
ncbi:MAG: ATP-binding protein [Actinomycetes bacterium]|jgi:two-component system sensor histidine kinase SenX3